MTETRAPLRFSVNDGNLHADGIFVGRAIAVALPDDIRKRVDRLAEAAFSDESGKIPDRSKVEPADLPVLRLPGLIAVLRAPTGPFYSPEVFVLIPPLDDVIADVKAERERVKAAIASAARYDESGVASKVEGIVEG